MSADGGHDGPPRALSADAGEGLVSSPTLPSGTVTFVVTDIEGSTRLFRALGDDYAGLLEQHNAVLRAAFHQHGGVEVKTEGDSLLVAFPVASEALTACLESQRALLGQDWPRSADVRVRMGVHTGEAHPVDGDYVAIALHQVARISAGAHGRQVLVSQATREAAATRLPIGASLKPIGAFQLRGFAEPARLYQLVHEDLPADFPPPRAIGIVEHNLPFIRTQFVGRQEERRLIADALRRTGVVSVVGAPGVGKTRLAVQVGFDVMDAYSDGVWLVELATVSDPSAVGRAIAAVMKVTEEPGRGIDEVLIDSLSGRNALLILDNCEHLLDAVAALGERLSQQCPSLFLLVTSREPLDIVGETVWRVDPLPTVTLGESADAATLREFDAARLFAERASLMLPNFEITDDNSENVAEIVAHLNGIPLAIELAAASLGDLSLAALAAGLGDRFELLTHGRRTAPDRHQTLRAAIEWSLDLLPIAERTLLQRMAVFAGSATVEATVAVCANDDIDARAVPGMIRHLARSSLLQSSREEGRRWTMLESVRELAAIELGEAGESEKVEGRHRAWFADFAAAAERRLGRRGSESAMDELIADHNNVRRAIDSAIAVGDTGTALEVSSAMAAFWTSHGDWTEGSERLSAALAAAGGNDEARRRAEVELGSLLLLRGLTDQASDLFLKARDGAGTLPDVIVAKALAGSGYISFRGSDLSEAQSLWEAALQHAEQAGDSRVIAGVLRSLAIAAGSSGEQTKAGDLIRRAIAEARQAQDDQLLRLLLGSSAEMQLWLGNYGAAEKAYGDALDVAARIGDMSARPLLLAELGWIAMLRGDPATAGRLAIEASELAEDMGNLRVQVHAKRLHAEALLNVGDFEAAEGTLEEARRAAEALAAPAEIAGVRCSEAGWNLEQERYVEAAQMAEEAISLSPLGHPMRIYTPMWVLGCTALAMGHGEAASGHFAAAQHEAQAAGAPRHEAASLWGMAHVALLNGDIKEGSELHWQALQIRERIDDNGGVASSLVGLAAALARDFAVEAASLVQAAATHRATLGLVATPRETAAADVVLASLPDAGVESGEVADYATVRESVAKLVGRDPSSRTE